MQLARIPYLVCGASKLQISHPLNKWNYIPPSEQGKSRFHLDSETTSFITKHIGIHNENGSLNLKASYFEIIVTIQSEFSKRFSEFDMFLIKYLRVLSPASNCFLDTEELQPLYSLVNSTNKVPVKISMLKLRLWKALSHQSFVTCFKMKTPVWIWTSFWNGFGSIKQLFPPYTCCWARA